MDTFRARFRIQAPKSNKNTQVDIYEVVRRQTLVIAAKWGAVVKLVAL